MPNFNSELGFRVEDDVILLDTRPEHQVAEGLIHFAVLATLAEVAAAHAVAAPVVPASIHLSLMSRAAPGRLRARGQLVKRGRTLSVAEGIVRQGHRLVAKATVTFAMVG